jgi:hypothetical protein
MPSTGLTVRGPRATELRSELTRITGDPGLRYMLIRHISIVCVDTATGPIRVTLNKTSIGAAVVQMAAPSSPKAAREMRAKVQDKLLRCICGFYGWPGPEVPGAPKGKGPKGRGPVTVQFNWTAPLDRPRPWTWTCGSTEPMKPWQPEKPGQPETLEPLDTERSECTVS